VESIGPRPKSGCAVSGRGPFPGGNPMKFFSKKFWSLVGKKIIETCVSRSFWITVATFWFVFWVVDNIILDNINLLTESTEFFDLCIEVIQAVTTLLISVITPTLAAMKIEKMIKMKNKKQTDDYDTFDLM
jgi:hypothetical protein